MTDRNPERHPAYGMAKVSSTEGPERSLFMAKAMHTQVIGIDISEGILSTNEMAETPMEGKRIIRLEMTPAQFVDLVTGAQSGRAAPVTIRYLAGDEETRPEPPKPNVDRTFRNMMAQRLAETVSMLDELIEKSKGRAGDNLRKIKKNLVDEIPYIERDFERTRDRMMAEVKAEIEASTSSHIRELGLEKMREIKLSEGREREEDQAE